VRFLAFLLFFFFVSSLHSQVVNIENKRIYDDTIGWSGNISGTFSAIQNQDLLFSANFRPTAQYKTKKQNYFLIGDFTYSKGQQKVYSNAGMFHFRFAQRIKNSPWKWESYTQIQYNELRDQAYRTLAGTGLRWKFYDKKNWKFFLGSSTYYEIEEIRTTGEFTEDIRWSNYLSWFIDPKTFFTFSGATYYQPKWEDFDDYRMLGQYTLSFKVTNNFSVKTDFSFFHDTNPPTDVRKTTFSTMFGFGLKIK
tara:strand:+ start:5345 stop:6097 length:753 start_codon:yes stop_codon:yes gene_type:complete